MDQPYPREGGGHQPSRDMGAAGEDASVEVVREIELLRRRVAELEARLASSPVDAEYTTADCSATADESFRHSIIAHIAEGLCVCHAVDEYPHVRFTVWNERMRDLTGYALDEINRLGWYQTVYPSPETSRRAQERMGRMREGQDLVGEEWEITRKDGQPRVVSISTSVLVTGDGLTHVLALMQDVTDRRRVEAQLQQAQKLESLGVLAGGIAHDFNNLLCGILGNADLALLDLESAQSARSCLLTLKEAAQHASDLCRQMLAYSGKGQFVVEPLDLSRLIGDMHQLLEVSVSKQARLRFMLPSDLPAVEADATQIRQIVLNLVINASEALEGSSGAISVSAGVIDCDREYLEATYLDEQLVEGRYVFLEVADTGCGMDQQTLARIFDPFFTTKFSGRGLGLAATLGIVRGHHGAIKIYSEPGTGTTFKVLLPSSQRAVMHERPEPDARLWSSDGMALVVDDEQTVRSVSAKMLEQMGFEVLVAADGESAVALFRRHTSRIVLVVLDLTMPGLSGEETFRELKRLRPEVTVILTSGYNEQDATSRFAGSGLAGFIQKPFTYAALREKIGAIVAVAALKPRRGAEAT